MGVIHDQTLSVGGISASILGYLVSRGRGPREDAEDIGSLKYDLVKTFYEIRADEGQLRPLNFHLSQADRERAQSRFAASLQYDGMIDRESRIATAHESTFRWIFQDNLYQDHQSQMIKWSNFRQWLESDDPLYWITGKAGSGKSTLMKFLCCPTAEISRADGAKKKLEYGIAQENFRCHPYLKKWAGPLGLVVASFYFWNSGMELQTTQVGLLRTLLYQLVAQRPEILPMIASNDWESLCLFDQCTERWSVQELHDMFFRAIETLSNDSKICLFVDGLDEFGDSHEDIISLVKDFIGGNGHVKICVASRPWNIFQTALGQKASLRLEDLTFDDIKKFVQSKFHADTVFENLQQRYPSFADQLMENIVVKASGVFLWVDLVVASLLAGMRLGDRIEDFQRRLDELPPDLEKLYEKILHSLDQFYLGHAAQYFTLVESAKGPLTILQFSFADEESPESAIKMHPGSMTQDEISIRTEAMNRRLNSRCKGFLETDRGLQSIQDDHIRNPSQLTVQYLHRTVRDFIKSPKAQKFLQLSMNPDFDPSIQLMVAYLMDVKFFLGREMSDRIIERKEELFVFAEKTFNYGCCFLERAVRVAKANEGAMIELMEDLKGVITHYKEAYARQSVYQGPFVFGKRPGRFQTSRYVLGNHNLELFNYATSDTGNSFLSLAVKFGVVPYVRARVEWGGLIRRPTSETHEELYPLLLDALSGNVPEPKMVECLLDLGADPNFKISKVDSQTPWITALTKMTLLYTIKTEIGSSAEYLVAEDKWKQTLRLMFSRGADGAKVPESLLTPISRSILRDMRDEKEKGAQSLPSWTSWLQAWKLG